MNTAVVTLFAIYIFISIFGTVGATLYAGYKGINDSWKFEEIISPVITVSFGWPLFLFALIMVGIVYVPYFLLFNIGAGIRKLVKKIK